MNFESLIPNSKVEFRQYQRDVVTETFNRYMGSHLDRHGNAVNPHKSILIESPTGSGKTVMGMLVAKALQQVDPDLHIMWTAMRRPLLNQAILTNASMAGCANFHAVSMFQSNPESVLRAKAEGKMVLMVVDEAQHDAASSSAHLHNIIQPDFVLGLSATPYRADKQKLCFEAVVKNAGIHALIDAGFLSKYEHFSIPEWTVSTVLEQYLADPDKWGKSIFYFLTLAECHAFAAGLRDAGVRCDVVTGDSDSDSQIDAFDRGEHRCLINCMKLTEGFDCPSLESVWVRDSSHGPTVQMCGRVLRKFPGLDLKKVIQSQHTGYPFQRTAMPEQSWVFQCGEWRSLKVNTKIDQMSANTIRAISTLDVQIPAFIKQRTSKKSLNQADPSQMGRRRR